MPLPEWDYLSVWDLAARWQCEDTDVVHLAETGRLRIGYLYEGGIAATAMRRVADLRDRETILLQLRALVDISPAGLSPLQELDPALLIRIYMAEPVGFSDRYSLIGSEVGRLHRVARVVSAALEAGRSPDGCLLQYVELPASREKLPVHEWKFDRRDIERFEAMHAVVPDTTDGHRVRARLTDQAPAQLLAEVEALRSENDVLQRRVQLAEDRAPSPLKNPERAGWAGIVRTLCLEGGYPLENHYKAAEAILAAAARHGVELQSKEAIAQKLRLIREELA